MEKVISRIMELEARELNNGFVMVYTRWKGEVKFAYSIIKQDVLDTYLEVTDSVINDHYRMASKFSHGHQYYAVPVVFVGEHPQDIFQLNEACWRPEEFGEYPPTEHKVLLAAHGCHRVYDADGMLLNNRVRDFVLSSGWDLHGLIKLSGEVDWLHTIKPDYGDLIYYVPGNGASLNLSIDVSPAEYDLYDRSIHLVLKAKLGDRYEEFHRDRDAYLDDDYEDDE